MTRRLNLFIVIFALLLGAPYYWYFIDNSGGEGATKQIDIAELRRLAASIPGEAPYAVEVEMSAFRRIPGNLLVAGSGIKRKLAGYMSFRLPVRGAKPVVIDSAMNAIDASVTSAEQFKPDIQARVERNLDQAGLILVTHEHPDHLGALVDHGGAALMQHAWLNPGQLPPSRPAAALRWKPGQIPVARITGTAPQAVAPGVVVIPAPNSHTPGSQLIFVRLTDGREFLFAGDIASFTQNWQEQRGRSRFVQGWFAPENRGEVFAWLKAIRALKTAAPALIVVPGHDFEWLENPLNHTGVKVGFGTAHP